MVVRQVKTEVETLSKRYWYAIPLQKKATKNVDF